MIYIKYRNGIRLRGVLMAMTQDTLRVAIQGADDAAIYRLISGVWVSEDCEVVTFEFDAGRAAAHEVLETLFPLPVSSSPAQRVM